MTDRIDLFTWMANLHIRFVTWRRGEHVGTDSFGNSYYRNRRTPPGQRERRWVIYRGEPEASKVPPEWHGWLHGTMDAPLPANSPFHRPWQVAHQPNPTGTLTAYRPPGHVLARGSRDRATGDYEPWTPS